jgi:hypothetical protein
MTELEKTLLEENRKLQNELLMSKTGITNNAVRTLMLAGNQTPGEFHTALLYRELVREEYNELALWWDILLRVRAGEVVPHPKTGEPVIVEEAKIELLDGCCDTIFTVQGLCEGMGFNLLGAYNEVCRSNLSKIMPDGKVHKNSIGKIEKPEYYSPPDLERFVC